MSSNIDWSDLPEELVDVIADRLSSNIDLLRIRSICKPWRSAVVMKKRFKNRFQGNLSSLSKKKNTALYPTPLFRVTLPSSCSSKGWLIRTSQVSESSKHNFLSPLSRKFMCTSYSNIILDLLKFAVSEICQSYKVQYLESDNILSSRSRVILIDNMIFALDEYNKIGYFESGEESKIWTTIKNQVDGFSDIILHRGHIYALDKKGAIWWISLSQLSTAQYSPSTPLEYYEIDSCKEKRLVECCGALCIVHRFCKNFKVKGAYIERTIGFKVYKMDEDLTQWVRVSSLGDKALIVAVDRCFMVVASEYYGCLANSIYFTDNDGHKYSKGLKVENIKAFKLEDGSIINMNDSSNSQSCFHMFSPPFL